MPRESYKKAILEAFAELKNGREVARKLGIHENTVYQTLKGERGICYRCGDPVAIGKKTCPSCLEADRIRIKAHKDRKLLAGICQNCDNRIEAPSHQFCAEHRKESILRNRARHARGSSKNAAQHAKSNDKQKLRSLKEKFGEAGIRVWSRASAACEICFAKYKDAILHIHHKDQNRRNNTDENLICLCFLCHTTTHRLLESRNFGGFMSWFMTTYKPA